MSWICPCGKTNNDDRSVCRSCGYQLEQAPDISEEQRRAQEIGIEWYQWSTSRDARVRSSHQKMDGVLVAWDDPPSPEQLNGEPSTGRYHAGEVQGCRCLMLPIADLAEIHWPARVYRHGRILTMRKQDFQRLWSDGSDFQNSKSFVPTFASSSVRPTSGRTGGKVLGWLLTIAGVVVLVLAVLVLRNVSITSSTSTPSATDTNAELNTPNPTTSTNRAPAYAIGQEFSVGYWSYVCHHAGWTSMIGSDFSAENANAAFLVIDVTVQNNDTSSSTLPPLQLLDAQGREYDHSTAGMLSERFFGPLESLNPGVSKHGYVAFDVPPNRQYFLLVSGGFESGKRAIVALPVPADTKGS